MNFKYNIKSLLIRMFYKTASGKYILGIRLSAMFEIFTMITLILGIAWLVGNENRFYNVNPHPFWIIILLMSVQYGTNESLFASLISTLFLYSFNIPEQDITETIYDYLIRLSIEPFLWIGTSVFIGELFNRHIKEKSDLKDRLNIIEKETETITDAYQRLKILKENLESRLAGELRSSIVIYEAAKKLESLSPSRILLSVEDIIISTMNPKKFSIYSFGENGFEPATSYGWQDSDNYILRFPKESSLYQEIVGQKRVFCVINAEDERVIKGQGMVVGPLIDNNSGKIFGMLKIEELGFMELNMRNIETFRILCEWIGGAYSLAEKFKRTQNNQIFSENGKLFSSSYFLKQDLYFSELCKKLPMFKLVITVKITDYKSITTTEYIQMKDALVIILTENIENTDLVFDEIKNGYGLKIIMLAANQENNEKKFQNIKNIIDKWQEPKNLDSKIQIICNKDE